jgi:hypothetical protein
LLHLSLKVIIQNATAQAEMITRLQGDQFSYSQKRAVQLGPMGATQVFHKIQTTILDHTDMTWGRPPDQPAFLAKVYIHGHALLKIGAAQDDFGLGREVVAVATKGDVKKGTVGAFPVNVEPMGGLSVKEFAKAKGNMVSGLQKDPLALTEGTAIDRCAIGATQVLNQMPTSKGSNSGMAA